MKKKQQTQAVSLTNQIVQQPPVLPAIPQTKADRVREWAGKLKSGELTLSEIGHSLGLTQKQIMFACYYTTEEFFGNGKQAYGEAYDLNPDDKNHSNRCSVGASNSLRHAAILTLIDIILDSEGLNEQFVDKQLLLVIQQSSDLKAKMLAIKEYNVLKSRVKMSGEVTVKDEFDYTQLSTEELQTLITLADKAKVTKYIN